MKQCSEESSRYRNAKSQALQWRFIMILGGCSSITIPFLLEFSPVLKIFVVLIAGFAIGSAGQQTINRFFQTLKQRFKL